MPPKVTGSLFRPSPLPTQTHFNHHALRLMELRNHDVTPSGRRGLWTRYEFMLWDTLKWTGTGRDERRNTRTTDKRRRRGTREREGGKGHGKGTRKKDGGKGRTDGAYRARQSLRYRLRLERNGRTRARTRGKYTKGCDTRTEDNGQGKDGTRNWTKKMTRLGG